MDVTIKAYEKVLKDLRKLREKAQEKQKKEIEKQSKKYIIFKGYECYTHDNIDDVYRYDECTGSECEKAHDKLDKLLNTNYNGDTATDVYIKTLTNYIRGLCEEIESEKFNLLPPEEQRKLLEERNKEIGAEY